MSFRRLFSTLANACLLLGAASLFAQTHTFTVFSAPHAGKQSGQGTIPVSINAQGVIAGYYVDSANHSHSFIREADGTITEFDPLGITDSQSSAINNRKEIVGYGTSNHGTTQGFLRRDGIGRSQLHIMVANSDETLPLAVNDAGVVTGFYLDGLESRGFVFDLVNGYTLFDDPDAGSQDPGFGTRAEVINRAGTIAGHYEERTIEGLTHGFVRDSLGNFTNFDAEGANAVRVSCTAINQSGQIAGSYQNVTGFPRSFFRDASGNVTNFSVPGSTDTTATGMTDAGTIVGHWNDSAFTTHGFIRDAAGTITTFDAPVLNLGTVPMGINNSNQIIGIIFTGTGVHAWVR